MITNDIKKYVLVSIDDIKTVTNGVLGGIEKYAPLCDEKKYEITLVLNELLVNCFKYTKPSAASPVILNTNICDGRLVIRVTDNGDGFEYEKCVDGLQKPGEDVLYRERGRGLMLVKALCQDIKYNGSGNSVEVKIVL